MCRPRLVALIRSRFQWSSDLGVGLQIAQSKGHVLERGSFGRDRQALDICRDVRLLEDVSTWAYISIE